MLSLNYQNHTNIYNRNSSEIGLNDMMLYLHQYERKCHDSEKWEDISETVLLVELMDLYGRVTPAIQQIIEGNHVLTSKAIYRLKSKL